MQNLSDINTIRRVMEKHGVTFNKGLGQNFLVDPDICPSMADEAELDKDTCVIEIGPGVGVLTAELAKRAGKVLSFELDKRLLPVLDETLSEFDNIEIINRDILKADLKTIIKEKCDGKKVCVCANLPYYITSPVIMMLLESRIPLENITVMVQKEAGERICAEVGSRTGGAVTVAVNYFSEATELFYVPREAFLPPPNVDSCVIQLKIRKEPPVKIPDENFFFRIVKAAFSQRRKTALNSLSAGLNIPKPVIAEALKKAGIPENARAENFTTEDFAKLSELLKN